MRHPHIWMNRNLRQSLNIGLWDSNVSENVSTLIEVLKALNLQILIPSSVTLTLLWKLYGFFNQLSEKLTRIETKLDGLKELLPYKIKEAVEQERKKEIESKAKEHNPSIETSDLVEIVGVSFGIMDILSFFLIIYQTPNLVYQLNMWLLFILPGLFGILPIIASEKRISKDLRALLSLSSLATWAYLFLVIYGVIPPFL